MVNNLKNLILLRWVAFIGMVVVFIGVYFLMGYQASRFSYGLVFLFGFSNLALYGLRHKINLAHWGVFLILAADSACLTFLLHDNGGSHNPFSILFLAIASVGALMLPLAYLLPLIVINLGELGFIYSNENHTLHHLMSYDFHLRGMWMANSIGVFLICAWIYYLRSLNDKMAAEQEKQKKILAGIEHMESLGRLAASAAHQLNTPVGTLQLGLSELSDDENPLNADEKKRWYHDMQQAIFQVTKIIDRLRPALSQNEDDLEPVHLDQLITTLATHWASPRKAQLHLDLKVKNIWIKPAAADDVHTILTALLDNALEAAREPLPIYVTVSEEKNWIQLNVIDKGEGMSEDVREKALDPLYTTKAKGTGLGLYIAHQLSHKYGGHVEIESEIKKGTTVRVFFKKELL